MDHAREGREVYSNSGSSKLKNTFFLGHFSMGGGWGGGWGH